jgi:hypothetical protein
MTLHEYRLDLFVDEQTMEVVDVDIEAMSLPYAECHAAPANIDRLIGLKLASGFTAQALARLEGEAGCTHLNSLISDLSIAGLFHGYIGIRRYERENAGLPQIPASDQRTGICAGWRAGGALAEWMETGRGIAPSKIYPTSLVTDHDG